MSDSEILNLKNYPLDGSYDGAHDIVWVDLSDNNNTVVLDGRFSLEELEEIIAYMRRQIDSSAQKEQKP